MTTDSKGPIGQERKRRKAAPELGDEEFRTGYLLAAEQARARGGRPRKLPRDLLIYDWVTKARRAGYSLSPARRTHSPNKLTAFEFVALRLIERGHLGYMDANAVREAYYRRRKIELRKASFETAAPTAA